MPVTRSFQRSVGSARHGVSAARAAASASRSVATSGTFPSLPLREYVRHGRCCAAWLVLGSTSDVPRSWHASGQIECEPKSGECEYEPKEGKECDDGNGCTEDDECTGSKKGVCKGKKKKNKSRS